MATGFRVLIDWKNPDQTYAYGQANDPYAVSYRGAPNEGPPTFATNIPGIVGTKRRSYSRDQKYFPRDYTGEFTTWPMVNDVGQKTTDQQYGDYTLDYGTGRYLPDDGLQGRQNQGQILKGSSQRKVSKNYNKAQDMIAEGRQSNISQVSILKRVAEVQRPIHNPSRKFWALGYTQAIQDIIAPFARNRQMNPPSAKRGFNRTQVQNQPSLKIPGPQVNIPTSMPFNIPR
jgi:hypothetical protein